MNTADTLLGEARMEGIRLEVKGDKVRAVSSPGKTIPETFATQLKQHKTDVYELLERQQETQALKTAITRLHLGETPAVRLNSRLLGHDFLLTATDEVPETIALDCPHFSLSELRRLLSATRDDIRRVFLIKEVFPASMVTAFNTGEPAEVQLERALKAMFAEIALFYVPGTNVAIRTLEPELFKILEGLWEKIESAFGDGTNLADFHHLTSRYLSHLAKAVKKVKSEGTAHTSAPVKR